MAKRTILDLLVSKGVLTSEAVHTIIEKSAGDDQIQEDLLLEANVSEKELLEAKSSFLGVPAYAVEGRKITLDVLKYIPQESAVHYQFAPLAMEDNVLVVGMVRPEDIEAREALKFISANMNIPFKIMVITRFDFNTILQQYKGIGGEVGQAIDELKNQYIKDQGGGTVPKKEQKGQPILGEDAPVTKIVAVILKHAIEGLASDIHIEPEREQLRVRFRQDGILYTSLMLPMTVHDAVVARIKILTNLQLDEKRKPQDGRFSAHVEGKDIDFRVSTFPAYFGEKVVIRILDNSTGVKELPDLGFAGRNLEILRAGITRPYGMILVTGPTGSGKSTTLYAIMQILNQEKSNIVSLEDPVEYSIEGINQSQVRPDIGYTFASGLRSVLRQDPDIIMVGEIRDKETAQLAIHAALTGHLVLSTLHTNSATGVIPRLIDMGVDPFLIPATLILAVGQRLVRSLCLDSRKEVLVEGKVKEFLDQHIAEMPEEARKKVSLPEYIYQGVPSGTCPKGTRGRVGVFEVLSMTPNLERLILEEQPSEAHINEEAQKQGMTTMAQDGVMKVLEGTVGMEALQGVVL